MLSSIILDSIADSSSAGAASSAIEESPPDFDR